MGTHCSLMDKDNFSILVLDGNPVCLCIISELLAKFGFRVLPFQTAEGALDSLRGGVAKEVEFDLVLAEIHVTNTAGNLASSDLFRHILDELQVPLITMCAYDDEEVVSENMALGASFHVLKPLNTGTLNILIQRAHEHRSRRVTSGSSILKKTNRRMDSSSSKKPKRMFISENSNIHDSENDKESDAQKACGFPKPGQFRWSHELHEKFLEAVEVLGLKYATPERIHQRMNVKDVTSKQIASHLQKHRTRKQKSEQVQDQQNASMEPLSDLILLAYNATTPKSPITPGVASTITEKCPVSWRTQMEKISAEVAAQKSVWDRYQNSLQKSSSLSSKKSLVSAKSKAACKGEGITVEVPNAVGKMAYGNGTPRSSPLTSLPDQAGENDQNEAAGNKGDLLDDTNKSATVEMERCDPSYGWEEAKAFWVSQLEGSLEDQKLVPDEQLQVDNAWNHALQSVSLTNTEAPLLIAQEGADAAAPAVDPVQQFAEGYDESWAWSPQAFGDYGMLL